MLDRILLIAIVVAEVRDLLAVRRGHRVRVGAFAVRQLADRTVAHLERVDLAAFERVLGIGRTVGRGENPASVRRPGWSAASLWAGAGVIIVAGGDLTRGAPLGRHDEDLRVSGLYQAAAVAAPAQAGYHDRRLGPLRIFGLIQWGYGPGRLFGHSAGVGDPFAVRRPCDVGRRLLKIGNLRFLAGVDPADVDLHLAAAVRKPGDALAIRRPERRGVAEVALGDWAWARACHGRHPEVTIKGVGHLVRPSQDVNNDLAVGADLR